MAKVLKGFKMKIRRTIKELKKSMTETDFWSVNFYQDTDFRLVRISKGMVVEGISITEDMSVIISVSYTDDGGYHIRLCIDNFVLPLNGHEQSMLLASSIKLANRIRKWHRKRAEEKLREFLKPTKVTKETML